MKLYSIQCTSFKSCMSCMHQVAHPHIQYSINKDINIHTLQIHKRTHDSCGVRSYCILSVLVQHRLCVAAAAVGLTSLQQYHCYSSSIDTATGTEFTPNTNSDGETGVCYSQNKICLKLQSAANTSKHSLGQTGYKQVFWVKGLLCVRINPTPPAPHSFLKTDFYHLRTNK